MKSNNEILDEFGKKIIEECLDGNIKQIFSLRKKENPPIIFKEKCDFLKSLSNEQFTGLLKILRGNFEVSFFEFFKIFEENENFKIVYKEGDKEINLLDISEDLKAEPIIENGWIQRFSNELKNENPI